MDDRTTDPGTHNPTRRGRRLGWRVSVLAVTASAGAAMAGFGTNVLFASAHTIDSTTPSAGGAIGVAIHDTANLNANVSAGRYIQFYLYGPGGSTPTCSPLVFTSKVLVTEAMVGAGKVMSGSFTPAAAGVYQWRAAVLQPDGKTIESGPTACGLEPVTITRVHPEISTDPSAGGAVGIGITDTATVSGAVNPTGTVTFKLFSPNDPTCSTEETVFTPQVVAESSTGPVLTRTVPLVPGAGTPYHTGTASSGAAYVSKSVGAYNWVVTYSGDANNTSVTSGCHQETVTTTKAQPEIDTTPSRGGTIGVGITDTADVTGGHNPTGTVTFTLYSPLDPTCAPTEDSTKRVKQVTVPLEDGEASSGAAYVSTMVGSYNWVATYNGDALNKSATSGCKNETVTTTKAQPLINTTPSAGGVVGTAVSDTATVTGGHNPTGTVTFDLYSPLDSTCTPTADTTKHVQSVTVPLGANGTANSGTPVTTGMVGTYNWVATYNGDANNAPAVSGCTAETVTITIAHPAINTTPSAGGTIPVSVTDTATVSGGVSPTGTVTFRLFSDQACTIPAAGASVVNLSPQGTATSGKATLTAAGTYSWTAVYSGDSNNAAVTSGCGLELVTATAPVTGTVLGATTGTPGTGVGAAAIGAPVTGADTHLRQGLALILLGVLSMTPLLGTRIAALRRRSLS